MLGVPDQVDRAVEQQRRSPCGAAGGKMSRGVTQRAASASLSMRHVRTVADAADDEALLRAELGAGDLEPGGCERRGVHRRLRRARRVRLPAER